MIKAALFDIDGTLLDSMFVWRNAATRYLLGRGVTPEPGLEEAVAPMHLSQGSVYLKARYHLAESAEEISAAVLAAARHAYESDVALKPGVVDLLQCLSAKGIPMGLATSGSASLSGKALERCGIRRFFGPLLTCDDSGYAKTDAGIYLKAAELLNAAPRETAVFEDSFYALSAARSAGFITVGVEDTENLKDREKILKVTDYYCGTLEADKDAEVRRFLKAVTEKAETAL